MKKTVLFVPGFYENINSRDYTAVITAIQSKGYKVQFVPINWRRTTIVGWVKQLNAVYEQFDAEQTILAGFSYGAMTALSVAARHNPHALWLFSLSPYYSEDLANNQDPSDETYVRLRRMQVFAKLKFAPLADKIACKTLIFVGDEEWPTTINRCEIASKAISRSELIRVPNTAHDVADQRYISQIVTHI